MMQCVLAGTKISSRKCKGTLKKLVKKKLSKATMKVACSGCDARCQRNKLKRAIIAKERKTKASKKKKVNPVSGKPCGSKAGPICHGYNLKCWRSGTLGNCKSACKKDRRCNLAEFKASSKTCCTSAIATKKACRGRWAKANGWIGYNICSKKTMVLLQTGAVKCGSTGRVNPVSGKPC